MRAILNPLATLIYFVALIAAARAQDWPTYRHDTSRTGTQPQASALSDPKKVSNLQVGWSFPTDTQLQTVVLGSDNNLWLEHGPFGKVPPKREQIDGNAQAFQALDSQTVIVLGSDKNLWLEHAPFGQVPPKREQIDGNAQAFQALAAFGPFNASSIVVNDTVFVGNDNGYFYVLDAATAKLKWQFPLASDPPLRALNWTYGIQSPAAYWDRTPNGAVIFGAQDRSLGPYGSARLFALDAKTGEVIWKSYRIAEINGNTIGSDTELHQRMGYSPPLVFDNKVYVGVQSFENPIQIGRGQRCRLGHRPHNSRVPVPSSWNARVSAGYGARRRRVERARDGWNEHLFHDRKHQQGQWKPSTSNGAKPQPWRQHDLGQQRLRQHQLGVSHGTL